jgi:hypothetical protein
MGIQAIVAVDVEQASQFGCPKRHCGCRSFGILYSSGGVTVRTCDRCLLPYAVIARDVTRSEIQLGGQTVHLKSIKYQYAEALAS